MTGASAARGHRAADGLAMLIEQGALAFERWFDTPAPRDVMWRAVEAVRDPTGAGQHEHARIVVGLEGPIALRQLLGRGTVDGVAPLGAVDRQHRRRADPLVANLPAHRPILRRSWERAG